MSSDESRCLFWVYLFKDDWFQLWTKMSPDEYRSLVWVYLFLRMFDFSFESESRWVQMFDLNANLLKTIAFSFEPRWVHMISDVCFESSFFWTIDFSFVPRWVHMSPDVSLPAFCSMWWARVEFIPRICEACVFGAYSMFLVSSMHRPWLG